MTDARPAPRPGGRSARVRSSVLTAAMELLAEAGYDAMELPDVARRAGVHPTTIYRRWGTKARLVGEAILEHETMPLSPTPDTGSLQRDLEQLLADGAALLRSAPVRALIGVLLADAFAPTPEVARARDRFWEAHRAEAAAIIARAAARGELPPSTDPELLIEMLIGPALVRMVLSGRPIDADLARSVAARVVAALG